MIIIDASALYPLVKLSQDSLVKVAERLLEEAMILDLTLYEVANAIVIEVRRGFVKDPHRLITAISELVKHLTILRVKPEDLEAINKLAERLDLTSYDAAYIYYAKVHKAKLITSDKEILMKAKDIAVDTSSWLQSIV